MPLTEHEESRSGNRSPKQNDPGTATCAAAAPVAGLFSAFRARHTFPDHPGTLKQCPSIHPGSRPSTLVR